MNGSTDDVSVYWNMEYLNRHRKAKLTVKPSKCFVAFDTIDWEAMTSQVKLFVYKKIRISLLEKQTELPLKQIFSLLGMLLSEVYPWGFGNCGSVDKIANR